MIRDAKALEKMLKSLEESFNNAVKEAHAPNSSNRDYASGYAHGISIAHGAVEMAALEREGWDMDKALSVLENEIRIRRHPSSASDLDRGALVALEASLCELMQALGIVS